MGAIVRRLRGYTSSMEQIDISKNGDHWQSVNSALELLEVSRRTLYDYISRKKLQTKKEGKYRYVWIDDDVIEEIKTSKSAYIEINNSHTDNTIEILSEQIKYLQEQNNKLAEDLKEQNQRHDAIVLGMTNAITEQKLELSESKQTLNTKISALEQELLSTKSDLEAVSNRGFWARLFNR